MLNNIDWEWFISFCKNKRETQTKEKYKLSWDSFIRYVVKQRKHCELPYLDKRQIDFLMQENLLPISKQ